MARRASRKRRRERRRDEGTGNAGEAGTGERKPTGEPNESDAMARGYARGRAKDEAARAALRPLEEGERPPAVAAAGVLALGLGTANLVAYLAGVEIGGERPQLFGVLAYSGLMLAAAWGCLKVRYWAVLGMQALLGLAVIIFALLLIRAESLLAVVIALAVIGGAGTLFWFLVKSMARIQMPERPGAE